MGCLIVQHGGDSQTGVMTEVFLHSRVKTRVLINRKIVQRPQFPDSIGAFLSKKITTKDGSLFTQFFFAWIPPSGELRNLLLKGHPGKQVRHPLVHWQFSILIRPFLPGYGLGRRFKKTDRFKRFINRIDKLRICHLFQPPLLQKRSTFQSGLAPTIPHIL